MYSQHTDTTGSVNKIIQSLYALDFKITPAFDGVYHRFDRLKKKSGWYISSFVKTKTGGEFPLVVCGDWVSGEKHKVIPFAEMESSIEVRAAIEKAMAEDGQKRKEKQELAASVAREEWELAEQDRPSAYMERKGFTHNFGCRVSNDGVLLVPTVDECGTMHGMERIFPDGVKRYLAGQRMKGCFYVIGNHSREQISYLCEGFATGCSIHELTGKAVVVAFSANNMIDVAKAFVGWNLIPAADNDRFTEGNPGISAAQKASAILGHRFISPTFPPEDKESTDYNDLHQSFGADTARKQLEVLDMSNVIGIKTKKEKAPAKRKMSEVYKSITDAMQGKNLPPVPDFGEMFHVVEPSPGTRLIAKEIEPEVVHYVSEKAVTQSILKYAHDLYLPRTGEGVGFEQRHANDCMKFWRDLVDPIPEPKMVSWPGEDGYTLRRMPWPMGHGPTPLFDELMGRTSNAKALRCFIGSLFFPKADRQQYVWIFGQGQNGKGALSRFLRKALNGAYSAQMVPTVGDKFWTSGLIGARLVVFPDCNNKTFVASGLFKSLTGGDPVKIEQKGQQPFTTELNAKFMFLSNERPHISSEKADLRRAIYCEMGAITGDVRADYEEDLWAEGGAFLTKCFSEYEEACPKHGPIKLSEKENSSLSDWVSTVEEEFEIAAKAHFEIDKDYSATPASFSSKLNLIWPKDKQMQSEFRGWLERKHGVRKITSRPHKDAKIYTGIGVVGYSLVVPPSADGCGQQRGQQRGQQESQEPVDVDGADT